MAQAAFRHDDSEQGGRFSEVLAPSVTIFADEARGGGWMDAAESTGLATGRILRLSSLREPGWVVLGDVVLVDCTALSVTDYGALLRLDERAMRAGAKVIAVVAEDSLDAAFGCLATAQVQFLLDPTPSDLVLALALARPGASRHRVREMDESDRVALMRLSEEVGKIAARLDSFAVPLGGENSTASVQRLATPSARFLGAGGIEGEAMRRTRAPLPDPRLVQRIIRQRRLRDRYFPGDLFADPAWDILLDLTAARAEHRRVCVTSLCIAASVPPTTALRWIQQMCEMGMLKREQDPEDKRRAFIVLADSVADAMARYFDELGKDAGRLV